MEDEGHQPGALAKFREPRIGIRGKEQEKEMLLKEKIHEQVLKSVEGGKQVEGGTGVLKESVGMGFGILLCNVDIPGRELPIITVFTALVMIFCYYYQLLRPSYIYLEWGLNWCVGG